jgi:hypothetical protein
MSMTRLAERPRDAAQWRSSEGIGELRTPKIVA